MFRERWYVDCCLKNGGQLFYGSTDPKVSLEWTDMARGVPTHIGWRTELWVHVAIGDMHA